MEKQQVRLRWQPIALAAIAAALLWMFRSIWWALLWQLGAAGVLLMLGLPLCRRLERRLSSSWAAGIALFVPMWAVITVIVLMAPLLFRQVQQLTDMLPALAEWARERYGMLQSWLEGYGVSLSSVWDGVFSRLSEQAGAMVSAAAGAVSSMVQSMGKVLLSPLIAFYLLRDRQKIASWLMLTVPVTHRARAVRAAREMRRETAGFFRGQLMLSLAVGLLTALALLLTGTPGWLLLGALMGVLELIPYLGPLLAGIPAVILALQGGLARALWTLGALILVQQVEGAFLSPRLLSGATRLHPLAVLLAISAGGMIGGALGMVLAIPAVTSLRGALRGWKSV